MEPFLGQIQLFTFGWPPVGWMTCEGQTLQISQNQALFSLLGPKFGGNGTTTFCLPDLRSANLANGSVFCIAIQGFYPPRS